MGYRAKIKIELEEGFGGRAGGGGNTIPHSALLARQFFFRPIPHLGACSQAKFCESLISVSP